MRIKQIEIKGLFGMFNHKIPLNLENHITIIYGINGIGKTMLFKILDNLFNLNYSKLVKFPFKSLIIDLDNDESIILNNSDKEFIIEHKEKKEKKDKTTSFDLSKFKNLKLKSNDANITRKIIDIFPVSRISDNKFIFHDGTDEVLSVDEIVERFPDLFVSETKNISIQNKNELDKLLKNLNLYFIQTQRLLDFSFQKNTNNSPFRNNILNEKKIDTVQKYSQELSKIIQEKHKEYAKKSEEFELSLGKRLRSKEVKTYSDIDELRKENELLETKRTSLKSVGLFEEAKDETSNIPDTIDEIERAVLSVNIQDMKNKLKIFDDLYEKLKVFLDVLNNKRFSYKKISIDPKKGFVFKNDNQNSLEVTELSSGEQHEIVLLYELLFKVNENSLVLIDEPEISLHVVWQMEFLKDLEEIVKIRNFDLLIATHSPSIINGNWDLTVELTKDLINER